MLEIFCMGICSPPCLWSCFLDGPLTCTVHLSPALSSGPAGNTPALLPGLCPALSPAAPDWTTRMSPGSDLSYRLAGDCPRILVPAPGTTRSVQIQWGGGLDNMVYVWCHCHPWLLVLLQWFPDNKLFYKKTARWERCLHWTNPCAHTLSQEEINNQAMHMHENYEKGHAQTMKEENLAWTCYPWQICMFPFPRQHLHLMLIPARTRLCYLSFPSKPAALCQPLVPPVSLTLTLWSITVMLSWWMNSSQCHAMLTLRQLITTPNYRRTLYLEIVMHFGISWRKHLLMV